MQNRRAIDEAHQAVIRALDRVIHSLARDPHNMSFKNRTHEILTNHRNALNAAYDRNNTYSATVGEDYCFAIAAAEAALRERQIHCRRVWNAFKILMGLVIVGFAAGLLASMVFFTPVAVPVGATTAYAAAAFLINLKFGITLCSGAIPFFGSAAFFLPMMNKGHEERALTTLADKLKAHQNTLGEPPSPATTI